jgi:hypothetical protein
MRASRRLAVASVILLGAVSSGFALALTATPTRASAASYSFTTISFPGAIDVLPISGPLRVSPLRG